MRAKEEEKRRRGGGGASENAPPTGSVLGDSAYEEAKQRALACAFFPFFLLVIYSGFIWLSSSFSFRFYPRNIIQSNMIQTSEISRTKSVRRRSANAPKRFKNNSSNDPFLHLLPPLLIQCKSRQAIIMRSLLHPLLPHLLLHLLHILLLPPLLLLLPHLQCIRTLPCKNTKRIGNVLSIVCVFSFLFSLSSCFTSFSVSLAALLVSVVSFLCRIVFLIDLYLQLLNFVLWFCFSFSLQSHRYRICR